MLALLLNSNSKILVDNISAEMGFWLEENIGQENIDYAIMPNQVCIKHVFIPRPGQQNEYETQGYYVCFDKEEHAMAFKLKWT